MSLDFIVPSGMPRISAASERQVEVISEDENGPLLGRQAHEGAFQLITNGEEAQVVIYRR